MEQKKIDDMHADGKYTRQMKDFTFRHLLLFTSPLNVKASLHIRRLLRPHRHLRTGISP
jgi:hypothetical protein